MAITKISPSVVDFDSALVVSPTLTIGDATAEDTKIVFDGNAQDYYIGLDDSADDLVIGLGSAVGTTPAIVIDENLNVGVGVTPTAPLHVDGAQGYASSATNLSTTVSKASFRMQGSSDSSTSLFMGALTNDAQMYVQSANGAGSAADDIILNPFGGSVGIGVGNASPDRIFHAKRSDSGGTVAKFENSAGTVYIELNTDNQAGGDAGYLSYDSNKKLGLWTDDTQQVTVDTNGKVGIGTGSPSSQLHVYEETANTNTYSNIMRLESRSSGTTVAGFGGGIYFLGERNGDGALQGMGRIISLAEVNSGTTLSSGMAFHTATAGTPSEKLRISHDGKVGIGTTAPGSLMEMRKTTAGNITGGSSNKGPVLTLHHEAQWENGYTGGDWLGCLDFSTGDSSTGEGVRASVRTTVDSYYNTNSLAFYTATGNNTTLNERMRIDHSGHMGFNTNAIQTFTNYTTYHFSCASDKTSTALLIDDTNSDNGRFQILMSNNGYIGTRSNDDLIVTTNDAERMRIFSDGSVGLGPNWNGTKDSSFKVMADQSGWASVYHNDGNGSNRYGIKIGCGADNAAGTNYAMGFDNGNFTTNQGYITFSGGTVNYGAFTAHHPCVIPDADNDPDSSENAYPYGTLLETISLSYTQSEGADTERGIRYSVQKSSGAYSKKVLGAYGSSMNDAPHNPDNEHQALVLGDGHILCNNEKGNISVGDGICTSSTAGIGMKADKMAMIIGIAQEDVTFSGSETKLVAVQYGLQQFTPWTD